MGRFLAVRLEDKDENKWEGIPKVWITSNDPKQCWWPTKNIRYKAENEILWNGDSRGWYLRSIPTIDAIIYVTYIEAEIRSGVLNHQELENERYDETKRNLRDLENKFYIDYRTLFNKQEKMTKAIEEIKMIIKFSKNQADVNKLTLGALLPIKDPKDLKTFETLFMTESWISPALTELIIILTDNENINQSISKILGAVFSNQLAAQCFWDRQSGIKIKDLSIIRKIDVTLKNIDANYEGFERDVTLWFEKNRKSAITPD